MTVLDACYREQDVRCLKMVYAAMNMLILDLRGQGCIKNRTPDKDISTRMVQRAAAAEFILEDSDAPFSFSWMCERLGADKDYIINAYKDGSINQWEMRESAGMGATFLLKRGY